MKPTKIVQTMPFDDVNFWPAADTCLDRELRGYLENDDVMDGLCDMYEEYIKYPSITKQRMFYETMEDILPDMKVIIEGANGSQIQQLLPLDSFNTAEATEE